MESHYLIKELMDFIIINKNLVNNLKNLIRSV